MLKVCPLCPDVGPQPLDNFGISRERNDGHNLYCRSCIRQKVRAARRRRKQIREAQKQARQIALLDPARKDMIRIHQPLEDPLVVVKEMIGRGNHTHEAIRKAAREAGKYLTEDQVSDAIAVLNCDHRVLEFRRIRGEAYFFLRRIA